MLDQIKRFFHLRKKKIYKPIDPHEIFIDSQNLPDFDTYQLEYIEGDARSDI